MSVENEFRALVRTEVEAQLKPLQRAVEAIQEAVATSKHLEASLLPVARYITQMLQSTDELPVKRGPGRPRKNPLAPAPAAKVAKASAPGVVTKGRRGRPPSTSSRACGIRGCKRDARAKGYCPAHYQKLRMLTARNQRPSAWIDFPNPGSVDDIKLPRGRAAAKVKASRTANAG